MSRVSRISDHVHKEYMSCQRDGVVLSNVLRQRHAYRKEGDYVRNDGGIKTLQQISHLRAHE